MSLTDPPIELLQLRTAVDAALEYIRDADLWSAQAADAYRLSDPDYAAQLDDFRADLLSAQVPRRVGTPASIARMLGELLKERR